MERNEKLFFLFIHSTKYCIIHELKQKLLLDIGAQNLQQYIGRLNFDKKNYFTYVEAPNELAYLAEEIPKALPLEFER